MKRQLRKSIKSVLATLPAGEIARQSVEAARALEGLAQWQAAEKVGLYMHMERELETTEMLRAAFEQNKRVFLPRIVPVDAGARVYDGQRTRLEMLEVTSLAQALDLVPRGKYRIREPTAGVNCFDLGGLDLVVVPGMAFTREGGRMGHGAGYYDTFVAEHEGRTGRAPVLVGVCFREQLVARVPLEPHDRVMDAVVRAGGRRG